MKARNSIALIVSVLSFILISSCKDDIDSQENIKSNNNKREKIFFNQGKQKKEVIFNFSEITFTEKKRKWLNVELKARLKLGGIDNEMFLYPSQIKTDKNDNIYVLDNADCSVKKFDKMGNFIDKYGRKGKGPGEFGNAFDFDIIDDGKVVIIGPNLNKFAVFENDKIFEFKPTGMALNLCFVSPNDVLIFQTMDPITMSPLRRINYKNDIVKDYQNILDVNSFSGENYGMLPFLMGDVHRYQSNKAIYVSQIMGYVVIYNEDGEITNAFKLFNDNDDSELTKEEKKLKGMNNSMVRFPSSKEYLFFYSNVYENNLYVFNNQVIKNVDGYVVDVYNLNGNGYQYSFLLSDLEELVSIYFSKNKLYVVKKNTEVEVFDYKLIGDKYL